MSPDQFTIDLDALTEGTYAPEYLSDDTFNLAVHEMERLGHDTERTADALREWIQRDAEQSRETS